MNVNGVTYAVQGFDEKGVNKQKDNKNKQTEPVKSLKDNTAAVYVKREQQEGKKAGYQKDDLTIARLKEDIDRRTQSLRELVEKLLLKQGQTFSASTDIYQLLREGKVEVDPKTRAQAELDIAEDGYWGVEQTSERLLNFAIAVSGGDPTKADLMIKAVKKGFDQATKAWGGDLPDICKRTLDTTIQKLEKWRDSISTE